KIRRNRPGEVQGEAPADPRTDQNRLILNADIDPWPRGRVCTQWHTACFDLFRFNPRKDEKAALCQRSQRGLPSEFCVTETVAAIVAAHREDSRTPAQTVARSFQRIRDHNDPAVFISLRDEKDALAEAEALSTKAASELPLFGVPVAVKDNI